MENSALRYEVDTDRCSRTTGGEQHRRNYYLLANASCSSNAGSTESRQGP
jgi:hypothetical protein